MIDMNVLVQGTALEGMFIGLSESAEFVPPVEEVTRLQCLYRLRNLSCEVTPYLSGKKWDRVQRDNEYTNWLELHHILGRGKGFDVWCNWIMISAAAHKYIHDHCPDIGRVACLYAKLAKQKRIERECSMFGTASFPATEFDPHWPEISFIPGWIESWEHQWRPEIQRMGQCVKKEIEDARSH